MTSPNPPVNAARVAALTLDVATLKRQVAELAAAAAVGGGSDVEMLRSEVSGLGEQVDTLTAHIEALGEVASAQAVAELADAVLALQAAFAELGEDEENARRSWFELDPAAAANALSVLDPWVRTILARHGKVLDLLRPCWWQHPVVVEELLVLSQLWHKTYRGKKASPDKAADWHHRWLPGWLDRIHERREFSHCESEHTARPPIVPDGWAPIPATAITDHVTDWATSRAQWPPPRRNRPVPVHHRLGETA